MLVLRHVIACAVFDHLLLYRSLHNTNISIVGSAEATELHRHPVPVRFGERRQEEHLRRYVHQGTRGQTDAI